MTGPRRSGEPDGPDEFHVVILDNGRSQVLGSEGAEILACIRCGACLNVCPVYRASGGHAYDAVYSGPVGAVLTPSLHGLAGHADLPHASSLCGACKEACPVRIDIPELLLTLRSQLADEGLAPAWLRRGVKLYTEAATRPAAWRSDACLGRAPGSDAVVVARLAPVARQWLDRSSAFPTACCEVVPPAMEGTIR